MQAGANAHRWIAHIDMDAFYASAELLRRPQLRGLPLVVGGRRAGTGELAMDAPVETWPRLRSYAGRGVVTTATYEARALGVHSGMGLMRAARLAPDAILLPADFAEYARLSRLFKGTVRELVPEFEDRGIDEMFLDLTPQVGAGEAGRGAALDLVARIKAAVRVATGMTCSIGLTPNKLLSKLASDLDKPDGLTLLDAGDLVTRIWPLAVGRINGIGPKAAQALRGMGISCIGELAAADPARLVQRFGSAYGTWLHTSALGRDERPVVVMREPKSMSRETTFERDLDPGQDRAELSRIFTELCEKVAGDLRRTGYRSRGIGLKLRFADFRTVTREQALAEPTDAPAAIRRAAGQCLKRVALDRRIRLLGVRAGALCRSGGETCVSTPESVGGRTMPLFGTDDEQR